MSFIANFPLFSIILCLLCSVVSSVLKGKAARMLSLTLTLVTGCLSVFVLILGLQTGTATTYMMGHYPHPWGNEIRFGILEPLFAAVFSFVMFLSLVGGRKQLEEDLEKGKSNLYYVMADLVLVSLLALTYTNDVFTAYVFIEICTISACGLLMIRQIGRTTLASVRYMIFSLVGSGLFLLGVILLYGITGNLLMPSILESVENIFRTGQYSTALVSSMALITIGLAIKSGLFPFHYWMPDTYGSATVSSAAILSGLVSKGYIFLLVKIICCVFGTEVFYESGVHNILFVFGLLGMIVGSVSAIRERDVFLMTALSSAAQIGYIYMGIGISIEYGIVASLFHILTHIITKPLLFLSAGQLSDVSGGSSFASLQGSGHRNRMAGTAFSIGAFSMIGIPATMGFLSKYLFASAALHASTIRMILILATLAVSTVLNAVYFGKTVVRIYTPAEGTKGERITVNKQTAFTVSSIFLILMNLFGGIFSQIILNLLEKGFELL